MYLTAYGDRVKMNAIKEALADVGISSKFIDRGLLIENNDGSPLVLLEQDDRYFLAEKGL